MMSAMGCGRLEFDPLADAAALDGPSEADVLLGHDEDGDGVPTPPPMATRWAIAVTQSPLWRGSRGACSHP